MALFWFGATLALYVVADRLFTRSGGRAWAHPVILPTLVLVAVFALTGLPLEAFREGTAAIDFLLSAAVVALAVPLFLNARAIRSNARAVLAAMVGGSVAGSGSAMLAAALLASPDAVTVTLGAKSVTTPIAVSLAEIQGGIPSVAASVVILSGLVAALAGPEFLKRLGIDDPVAIGVAMGVAGHGLGTAEAVRRSELMGGAAGFAMAANGLLTALTLPWLVGSLFP